MHPCAQASHIPDDHRLWRRIEDADDRLEWDAAAGCHWPRREPPSVQVDDDGMSAYWAEHLEQTHGETPEVVLTPQHTLVFEFDVSAARNALFLVNHTPQATTAPDCAHTSVTYRAGTSMSSGRAAKDDRRNQRFLMSRMMRLAHGEITTQPPPGA